MPLPHHSHLCRRTTLYLTALTSAITIGLA